MQRVVTEFNHLSGIGPSLTETVAADPMLSTLAKAFSVRAVRPADVKFIRYRKVGHGVELEDKASRLGDILTSVESKEADPKALIAFLKKHGAKPAPKVESMDEEERSKEIRKVVDGVDVMAEVYTDGSGMSITLGVPMKGGIFKVAGSVGAAQKTPTLQMLTGGKGAVRGFREAVFRKAYKVVDKLVKMQSPKWMEMNREMYSEWVHESLDESWVSSKVPKVIEAGGKVYAVRSVGEIRPGTAMARTIDARTGKQAYTYWLRLQPVRGKKLPEYTVKTRTIDAYLRSDGTIGITQGKSHRAAILGMTFKAASGFDESLDEAVSPHDLLSGNTTREKVVVDPGTRKVGLAMFKDGNPKSIQITKPGSWHKMSKHAPMFKETGLSFGWVPHRQGESLKTAGIDPHVIKKYLTSIPKAAQPKPKVQALPKRGQVANIEGEEWKVASVGKRVTLFDGTPFHTLVMKYGKQTRKMRFFTDDGRLVGRHPTKPSGGIYHQGIVFESLDESVAGTILTQMGGPGRLRAMIGAKHFIDHGKALSFQFPNRKRSKGNFVKVTLRPDDTYDMEFSAIGKGGLKVKKVKKYSGIFFDQLQPLFTEWTGLYLHL